LREPLFWFFIVGGLLFVADSYLSEQPDQIIVTAAQKDRLNRLWETQTGKPASAEELESLVENWIKEEVFYREALRLGLDKSDSIVRRRLVQKLGFLVEEVEDRSGEWESVEAYYKVNIGKYSLPIRYSFSQIFFSQTALLAGIRSKLDEGSNWQKLGENSMLNPSYVSKSEKEISAIFGKLFTTQLFTLVQDEWVGPVRSSYGFHLVRLERILPNEATPLAYIEKKVVADYQQSKRDSAIDTYYSELLEKYGVVYE
jgi:hypothetical protein